MKKSKPDGTMEFTPEKVADGSLKKFVDTLIDLNVEIHIWSDGYCIGVDYIQPIDDERLKYFAVINEENGDYIGNYNEEGQTD